VIYSVFFSFDVCVILCGAAAAVFFWRITDIVLSQLGPAMISLDQIHGGYAKRRLIVTERLFGSRNSKANTRN